MKSRRLIALMVLATLGSESAGCSQLSLDRSGTAPSSFLITLQRGDLLIWSEVVALSDGGYLVLGRANYIRATEPRVTGWLARLSDQGTLMWEKEVEPTDRSSQLYAGAEAGPGLLFAAGAIGPRGEPLSLQPVFTPSIPIVLRMDRDGTKAWTRTLTVEPVATAWSLIVSKGGMVVVAGTSDRVEQGREVSSVFVAALTLGGDLLWQRILPDGVPGGMTRVREMQAGGYLVTGQFGLARLDGSGKLQWRRAVESNVAAAEMNDGSLVIAAGFEGVTVARLAADGTLIWEKKDLDTSAIVPAGLWISTSGNIVVAGVLKEWQGADQLWLAELSADGEERAFRRLRVTSGAWPWHIRPTPDGGFVAVGTVTEKSPGEGSGWLFRSVPRMR